MPSRSEVKVILLNHNVTTTASRLHWSGKPAAVSGNFSTMFVNTALTRVQLVSRSGQSPSKTLVRGELYASPAGAFVPRAQRLVSGVTAARPSRTLARQTLSMNLFSRFFRVIRANLNALVSRMEDPEKVLTQSLEDVQKDLLRLRQAYAEVSASKKRLERQREAALKTAAEWQQRARLALEKGNEDLAREALLRKKQQEDMAKALENQLRMQAENTAKLYSSMQQLEAKISEAQAKKDEYITRARTAKTAIKVNEMLTSVDTSSALSAFERMQEKVETLESQAEVSRQMIGSGDASLESQFRALEAGTDVDEELNRMRRELRGDSSYRALQASRDPEIDEEIQRMKREQQQR
jgi:phage shock protein A